jgi:hypothetical protein
MKLSIILSVTIAALLAGCGENKNQADAEQLKKQNAELAGQLAAKEQALAEEKVRTAQAEADRVAEANRVEAERLAAERASIEAKRKRIEDDAARTDDEKRLAMEAELRKRDEAVKAAELKAAAARREAERARNTPPTGAGRNVDFFYTALDPYGDWDEVDGYGPVFLPREAQQDRKWRPYSDGEWVRSEQGWTWRSNEPHGWATCHYGRWVRHVREGWMWVPGSEWAPAWVSWRKSETHIGWAPLPPEAHSGRGFNASVDAYFDIGVRSYNFVPRERFGAGRTYVGRIVEPEKNVTIIQNTMNVTNITYRNTGSSTVIVNEGPDVNFINARASAPIQIVRLQRDEMTDGSQPVVAAGLLRLFAPEVNHERPIAKPTKVRKKVTREMDRGWNPADAAAEKVIRQKVATEARKAEDDERETFRKQPAEKKPAILKPQPPIPPQSVVKPVAPPAKTTQPPKVAPPKKEAPHPNEPNTEKPEAPATKPETSVQKQPHAKPVQPAPEKAIPTTESKPSAETTPEAAPKTEPPIKPVGSKPEHAPSADAQRREKPTIKTPPAPKTEQTTPKPPEEKNAAPKSDAKPTTAPAPKAAKNKKVKPDGAPDESKSPNPVSSAQKPVDEKSKP